MWLLFATGALWWTKRRLCAEGAAVVLTFHRVLEAREYSVTSSLAGIVVKEETFTALMRYISQYCAPIDLKNGLPAGPGGGRRISVAVTFDDGWRDNWATAAPIASRYNVPVAIFVCPELAGERFPFWPEAAVALWRRSNTLHSQFATAEVFVECLKRLRPEERKRLLEDADRNLPTLEPMNAAMTWDEMAQLSRKGVVFGSHTCTHAILVQLDEATVERELTVSREMIEQNLSNCRWLAYPNGDWSPEVRDKAEAAGYEFAFTTLPGVMTRRCDSLLIPRMNVWEGKITAWRGRFSRVAFEYGVFWKAAWAAPRGASGELRVNDNRKNSVTSLFANSRGSNS
jgi:peptidoglycan/xylan/chitin deacetylase (PgdA/CDA1 family)